MDASFARKRQRRGGGGERERERELKRTPQAPSELGINNACFVFFLVAQSVAAGLTFDCTSDHTEARDEARSVCT